MIYFLCLREGGNFIMINRPNIRPKNLIKYFIKKRFECIAVFKNGIIYDGFLFPCLTPLRHKLYGGRRMGKQYYKDLSKLNLPEEEIR